MGLVAAALLAGWLLVANVLAPLATTALTSPSASVSVSASASASVSPAGRASSASASPGAAEAMDAASGLRWVSLSELPPEASATLTEIKAGPPFPTRKDGAVFGNFEGLLPGRASGYYREFTVPTPGEDDRGARRIVTGGPGYGVAGGEFYYTGDHYQSFERVRP